MRKIEDIVIRRMTVDDIGQVLEVERACFSEPWSAEVFSATLLLPYAHYYVAEVTEEDGAARIIGECGVRDIVGEGEITNVAVHPDWQGMGVAGKMQRLLWKSGREIVRRSRCTENSDFARREQELTFMISRWRTPSLCGEDNK